jgi:diguanylate cyclase (GGDEF)-like protein
MNLKSRFLLLITAVFCGFVSLTWLMSNQLMNSINEKWGNQFVERQVMFDKFRTLSPLIREISLARKMATDPDIIQMFMHENDPVIRQKGIAAMENYRFSFRDHSYFAALAHSENYYFNDAENQYEDKQLRYVLSPRNADDRWFYATMANGKDYQVNLDPDMHLGVTKVWVNVLVKNKGVILGVIGTGIDLADFLKETVSVSQKGVHNLFVDKDMAIQLHNNPDMIDYMSIAKDTGERVKVDKLLKNTGDLERLRLAMLELEKHPDEHRTMWVDFAGAKHLLGVAYLPEVGWFDLTLIDTGNLVLVKNKLLIPFMVGAAFLLALLAMGEALRRWVLKPIAALQLSTDKIQSGDYDIDTPSHGGGEFENLSRSFTNMAERVRNTNFDLENKVRERTDELRRMAEYEQFRNRTLELLAGDGSLASILESVVLGVEQLNSAMICSVLLLSGDGKHLCKGVAPSLPDFYSAAIDGVEIKAGAGSCGTAAFTGSRVIVEDIATHPYWAPYKELAARAGLGSCWSQPILSASGKVLGTFAIYHHEVNTPTTSDIYLIEQAARLISISIARKAAEDEIRTLAFYDSLTGLPNRRLLLDRLRQALASSARSGREGALLFIDLDNFKTLNDTLGHDIGDLLLQQVAARLTSCVREGDTVARLGGDEFVVMLEDLSEQDIGAAAQVEMIGEKIMSSLGQLYQLDGHEHYSSPSIGATLFNEHERDIEELLKQADIAMYQAKRSGGNVLSFFDSKMQNIINTRAELERELRTAIDNQQFKLHYQIQVDSSLRPLGAEALIRWIHPERGLIPPLKFIPLAEEMGLILQIGQWVIEAACTQLKAWQQDTLTCHLVLAINVSAKQFRQADFVAQVQAAVQRHAINPMLLKLELTESLLLENIEDTIASMNALKAIGIQFSLDDFGTGYSSLQYLKRLPLDQLKIDQSFVRDLTSDSSDRAIVRTIIAMAKGMNLDVIAEGVEMEDQRLTLLGKGCMHYQGYLFSKPVSIEEFNAQIAGLVLP